MNISKNKIKKTTTTKEKKKKKKKKKENTHTPHIIQTYIPYSHPGGALNFFLGKGVQPGFPKYGACELTFTSEKGGLRAENFQIWGLVS